MPKDPIPFPVKPSPPKPVVEPMTFTVDNHGKRRFTVATPFHVIPSLLDEPGPPQKSVRNRKRR
jgi:hypothetical protein